MNSKPIPIHLQSPGRLTILVVRLLNHPQIRILEQPAQRAAMKVGRKMFMSITSLSIKTVSKSDMNKIFLVLVMLGSAHLFASKNDTTSTTKPSTQTID